MRSTVPRTPRSLAHRNTNSRDRPDRARRKTRACRDCSMAKIAGRNNRAWRMWQPMRPPMTASPERRKFVRRPRQARAPSESFRQSWRSLVIKIGRRRLPAPSIAASHGSRPSIRLRSAKVTSSMAFCDGDADGHDRAHEGLNVERRPREPKRHRDAGDDGWDCQAKPQATTAMIGNLLPTAKG